MRKPLSVSATDLSKMVFCEASVLRRQIKTDEDQRRLLRGTMEHARFEQAVLMTARKAQECVEGTNRIDIPTARDTKLGRIAITMIIIAAIMGILFTTNS